MKKTNYNLKNVTPEEMNCMLGACPGIYREGDNYLIIGVRVSEEGLQKLGVEEKVGDGEVAILVPKKLIDEKKK